MSRREALFDKWIRPAAVLYAAGCNRREPFGFWCLGAQAGGTRGTPDAGVEVDDACDDVASRTNANRDPRRRPGYVATCRVNEASDDAGEAREIPRDIARHRETSRRGKASGDRYSGGGMKYAIIIPDGAADEPQKELGGKTPIEAAHTPHMDRAALEAQRLLADLARSLGLPGFEFYNGVSYRNLLVYRGQEEFEVKTKPPHEFPEEPVTRYLPRGKGAEILRSIMDGSRELFEDHEINQVRKQTGHNPATQVWLWGQGHAPSMPKFVERFGVKTGCMITGVDLLRGLAVLLGWDVH